MRRLFAICALAAGALSSRASAQAPGAQDPSRIYASRAEIQVRVSEAEQLAASTASDDALRAVKRAEALALRQRLGAGDFAVGDRIIVVVDNEATLSDTATVRSGGTIQLGNLPPISLNGVLRSEAAGHLMRELARYVIEPRVTATPLLRVAVLGEVQRPGYYHVPADILLSDLVMAAGGPLGTADVGRSEIRRGSGTIYAPQDVQTALAQGLSLDRLHLRSGDELSVPQKRNIGWSTVTQVATVITGLATLVFALAR